MQATPDESRFWSMIEDAWKTVPPDIDALRAQLGPQIAESDLSRLNAALEQMIPALQGALGQLGAQELLAFDRVLEQKLYDLDAEEIHDVTGGSDDGFLYARGFIVAMGQRYYEAVRADPQASALPDAGNTVAECEEMCYLSRHVYEEHFGDMPRSGISRESGSNRSGWPIPAASPTLDNRLVPPMPHARN